MHWQNLAAKSAVRKKIWTIDHREAELFSVPASQAFDWLAWWEMAHTNVVSNDEALFTFVPLGTEAAFALFHWSGMLGFSEAHAERAGSLLKAYPQTFSTERVADATILRARGLHEVGADDSFIQLVWSRWFASTTPQTYNFEYSSKDGKRAAKLRQVGRGSRTMERLLRKSCVRRFSTGELRKVIRERLPGELGTRTKLVRNLSVKHASLYR